MNLFITGGTGTLGHELVKQLYSKCDRITIYSRDEQKQATMAKEWPEYPDNKIRYILGDVRNYNTLLTAMRRSDTVIHAAAMKHIDKCAYNPVEAINTNIFGTLNVLQACVENNVRHAWFVSTDKACGAISLYGASKAVSEQAWISYNNMGCTAFNIVRYGNVIGSRGSVFNTWDNLADQGKPLQVTHEKMTRFLWTIGSAAEFLILAMNDGSKNGERGCLYIPKMKRFSLLEIARKRSDMVEITGLRCPEKIHEDLILSAESTTCYDVGSFYIIYPSLHAWAKSVKPRGIKVPEEFKLTSEVL